MVWRFTIILIFSVLGCQGQYDRGTRQGNRDRGSQNHDSSNDRRMQKRDDTSMMYHNCFVSKGCFGLPAGCETRRDCDVLLTYMHNDRSKEFNFKMSGRLEQDNYMAMGLSFDGKMGEDAVTECYLKDNTVSVRESWNEGQSNTRTQQLEGHLFRGTYKDGWSTCEWSEDYIVESNNRKFNLVNSTLHILLARGPMQGDRIRYHTLGRLGSEEPVNFTAFEAISAAGVSDSTKIHGTFMVTAWIGFVSIGILLARHFKSTWESHTLCGVKIWFALHRGLMIAALLFVVVAFIVIFVHKDGWNYATSNPHAILGCIATAFGLFQPIMAAFRPAPDSSKRPIFNWLHFIVGNLAQLIAVITMFFAVSFESAGLDESFYWVLAIFVFVHILFHVLFQMQTWTAAKKRNEIKMVEMTSRASSNMQNAVPDKNIGDNMFRVLLLGIYVIFVAAILLALYVLIGKA